MKPKETSMSTQHEITRYFEEMKRQDIAKKYQSQEDCIEWEIKTSTGSRQRAQREHESEIYLEELNQKKWRRNVKGQKQQLKESLK